MDESTLRSKFRKAIGEPELPRHVRHGARQALKHAARHNPAKYQWIPGGVAAFLAIVTVATLVAVADRDRGRSPVTGLSPASCMASSLVVTGEQGEQLHPAVLPAGFVLTSGNEDNLGAMNVLTYSVPGAADQSYVEIRRYVTSRPAGSLVGGEPRPATVQGNPAVLAVSAPSPDWINVAWPANDGVVIIVTAYRVSAPDVLAVANSVAYRPGISFAYPATPAATVPRQHALAAVPGSDSSTKAILTSMGELDAVLHSSVAPGVDVIRPVWVVWGASTSSGGDQTPSAAVLDANSAALLTRLSGVDDVALSSLTDRGQGACEPPFGVLTRSEVTYLAPPAQGIVTTLKLMTFGILQSTQKGTTLGNCVLLTCDSSAPVWVWTAIASDWRLVSRVCPPPNPAGPPCQTPAAGSWRLEALDGRTGPQHSDFSGSVGGFGPLPADLAALPDFAQTT
jgi:hypothetical protein